MICPWFHFLIPHRWSTQDGGLYVSYLSSFIYSRTSRQLSKPVPGIDVATWDYYSPYNLCSMSMYSLDDCFLVLRYSYLRWGCGPSLVKVLLVSWIKNSQLRTIFTSHRKSQTSPPLHAFVRNLGSNVKSHHDDKPDMFGFRPYSRFGRRVDCNFLRFFVIWLVMDHSSMPSRSWFLLIHQQSFLKKKRELPRALIWPLSHKKNCVVRILAIFELLRMLNRSRLIYFQQFKLI